MFIDAKFNFAQLHLGTSTGNDPMNVSKSNLPYTTYVSTVVCSDCVCSTELQHHIVLEVNFSASEDQH